jgi:hypothetical protein
MAETRRLGPKESRCTEKLNIAPKHCSSNYESIQTIIFIQPGLSLYPISCRITRQLNLNCFAQYRQKLSFFGPQHIFSCCLKVPLPFLPEHSLPHLEQLLWLFLSAGVCWTFCKHFSTVWPFLCRPASPKGAQNLTRLSFSVHRLFW